MLAVLGALVFIQRQTATQQRHTTVARELAANFAELVAKDPGDSMLLAVEASRPLWLIAVILSLRSA